MNTKLSPQAVNLLKRVKEQILTHPETYDQGTFCGTQCCIAGHISKMCGISSNDNDNGKIYLLAKNKLELSIGEASDLFGVPQSYYYSRNKSEWGAQKITEFIEAHT